jgi:diguanylate cyclase (GGDEF)-like protein
MSKLQKQSILIVDDDANNRNVLVEMFKNHHKVILAKSGEMALELALKHTPDLILMDVLMAGMSGYDTLERLKASDQTREIPVVFITALDGSVDEERGLLLGAVDYITKPFHPAIARARVLNHLRSVRQRQLLEQYAMFDPLTELPNRRRLERAMNTDLHPGSVVSLVVIDIDHFKAVNDRYGHSFGDKVLQAVAEVLRSGVASVAAASELANSRTQVSRYGGEEFVLWLPGFDTSSALTLCESLRVEVESLQIEHPNGNVTVTISLGGYSTTIGTNGRARQSMIEPSDAALYQAKADGRNRTRWANDSSL